jgi:hypothetical protein
MILPKLYFAYSAKIKKAINFTEKPGRYKKFGGEGIVSCIIQGNDSDL